LSNFFAISARDGFQERLDPEHLKHSWICLQPFKMAEGSRQPGNQEKGETTFLTDKEVN